MLHFHSGPPDEGCDWLDCCQRWCIHKADCTSARSYYSVLTQMLNPYTKAIVKIVPPREVWSEAEVDAVYDEFAADCKAAWEQGLEGPAVWEASGISF
jgi:hypothetical protein